MKHDRWLQIARRMSLTTDAFRAKVGAVIVRKNELVSVGYNQAKTHPLAAKFSKHPDAIYIHAELAAIIQATRFISSQDWGHTTLYVYRTKYENGVEIQGLAKPCAGCTAAIAYCGIGKVVYTLNNSGYEIIQ